MKKKYYYKVIALNKLVVNVEVNEKYFEKLKESLFRFYKKESYINDNLIEFKDEKNDVIYRLEIEEEK